MIDFYTGAPVEGKPVTMHLDVRPALDSVGAAVSRVQWVMSQWKETWAAASPAAPTSMMEGQAGTKSQQS